MKKIVLSVCISMMAIGLAFSIGCFGDDDEDDVVIQGTTVSGTLTLPTAQSGKTFWVVYDNLTTSSSDNVGQTGTCGATTTIAYSISGLSAGTYRFYAVVDVDGGGFNGLGTGDYMGWHPSGLSSGGATEVSVPASGTVSDIDIVLSAIP